MTDYDPVDLTQIKVSKAAREFGDDAGRFTWASVFGIACYLVGAAFVVGLILLLLKIGAIVLFWIFIAFAAFIVFGNFDEE